MHKFENGTCLHIGGQYLIPFQKNGFALQVFVKCNLIRHKLEVYATNKETFSNRNGMIIRIMNFTDNEKVRIESV